MKTYYALATCSALGRPIIRPFYSVGDRNDWIKNDPRNRRSLTPAERKVYNRNIESTVMV